MVAKRALDFGSPRSAKRTKTSTMPRRMLLSKPETKNRELNIGNGFAVSATATFPVSEIASGAGPSDRVGAKIRTLACDVHLQVKDTTDGDFFRAILYVPKSITDRIAVSVNGAVDRDLYWVLWDKVIDLPQKRTERAHYTNTYRFPMSMITEYYGALSTEITKNGLYLYTIADSTTGRVDGHHRLWYQDN